jgi:hypothetical protein
MSARLHLFLAALAVGGLLTACGSSSKAAPRTYTISGTVSGLEGGDPLVLQDNGADSLEVTADGTFTFATALAGGAAYEVTVLQQPAQPRQTCTVAGGSGTVADTVVTSVAVTCTTISYAVGGTVVGLTGTGLVLQDNGGDDTAVSTDGTFTFPTSIKSGRAYAVTTLVQPTSPWQTCVVTGGTGTVGSADVSSVTVNCSTDLYTVGGTVTGLVGTGLVLENDSTDDLTISGTGTFAFSTALLSGAAYGVAVLDQPTSPWQTCSVTNDTGTLAGANVTDVAVACVTNTYNVTVTVTGLEGSGLDLQDNGGDDLTPTIDGTYTFPTQVASGQTYDVEVAASPADETCELTGNTGAVAGTDVAVTVACGYTPHAVNVTVSGVTGTGLVLQDNDGDDLAIDADGTYSFATAVRVYSSYDVTIASTPASETCLVSGGAGTMADADVTLSVLCSSDLDFEDGLTGWTTFGSTAPVIDAGTYHAGSASAFMGGDNSSGIYRDVTLPTVATTLQFWVRRGTSDSISWDQQYAEIRDTSGNVLAQIYRTCENSDWTPVSFDLSSYAGQTVRIMFRVAGDSWWDATWQWIDDVQIL